MLMLPMKINTVEWYFSLVNIQSFNLPPIIHYSLSKCMIILNERFTGRWIYSFNKHDLDRGYPKPLTAIGLPFELQKIDDIWIWGHNNQTFIFSGTQYWA